MARRARRAPVQRADQTIGARIIVIGQAKAIGAAEALRREIARLFPSNRLIDR
jgi:hypothetical protein